MAIVLEEKIDLIFNNEAYVSDEPAAIHAFLEEHPSVPLLLMEAIDPVRQVFGKDTLISLFLIEDHDSDDIRIFARIQTALTIAEAQDLRSKFYSRWWNENIHRANDRLVFGLEFVDG